MIIIEPEFPAGWEKEHRYQFAAKSPAGPHVVLSGAVVLHAKGEEDDQYTGYDVRIVVGPWWRDVASVVPFVTIAAFVNDDWDSVDEAGWGISKLEWDTIGGPNTPAPDEERIRLKFNLSVKGEGSMVFRIAYQLTARGRRLGVNGLNSPGPVH
ncbi:MAG: hypothetical protein ACR2MM_02730 [Flavobacteriaceae bacterium]